MEFYRQRADFESFVFPNRKKLPNLKTNSKMSAFYFTEDPKQNSFVICVAAEKGGYLNTKIVRPKNK